MFNIWGSCWYRLYSNMVQWLWLPSSAVCSRCVFFLGWFHSRPLAFLVEHPTYLASLMVLGFYCTLHFISTFSRIARLRAPCKESTSAPHCLASASFLEVFKNFLRIQIFPQRGIGRPKRLRSKLKTVCLGEQQQSPVVSLPAGRDSDQLNSREEISRLSSCVQVVQRAPGFQLSLVGIPVGLGFSVVPLLLNHFCSHKEPSPIFH